MKKKVKKTYKKPDKRLGEYAINGGPGRPKGSVNESTKLKKALEKIEKEKGYDLFEHFVRRALKNDTVLIAAMKKLVSDKIKNEIEAGEFIVKLFTFGKKCKK